MIDTDTLQLETMLLEHPAPGVAVLTLNRPDRLNAMTRRMFDELMAVPLALKEDDDLRALVITGAGRGFCAGYDLDQVDEITQMGVREFLKFQELATGSLAAIRGLRVPVIAAVNGAASVGELGTSWTLTRLVGPARAAEIAYTARFVDAEEAERIGLVNRVVPAESLMDEALAMASQIASNSPGGVQLSKRALQANLEIGSYAAALETENRGQALLTRGEDKPEALEAFKQKREPHFTGR